MEHFSNLYRTGYIFNKAKAKGGYGFEWTSG